MKYRALLVGRNQKVLEDMFTQPHNYLELESCSTRSEDVLSHLHYYKPHVMIYCLEDEDKEDIQSVCVHARGGLPLTIIGNDKNVEEFINIGGDYADLVLNLPISVADIEDQVLDLMQDKGIDADQRLENEAFNPEEEMEATAEINFEPTIQEIGRRKHVLVIDDDPGNLKMLKEQLHEEYDVGIAPSGKVAMRFLETKRTDLILLDYEMPEEDGPTVMAKIRQLPQHKDTPIVFLTGITEREKIQKALVLKPQGYLLKPIEQRKLMQTIKGLIG